MNDQPLTQQVQINLYPAQYRFRHSKAIYRGYVGGRGAGKSFVGAYDLVIRSKPNRLYGVYAPTYPQLRDATARSLTECLTTLGILSPDGFNKSTFTFKLDNGAEIICRSLDDPESARGPNLSGAWFDELSVLKNRDGFDIVIASLRQGGEQGWLSATFTPKGRRHFTYDLFGKNTESTFCVHSKSTDNPFLPEGFVDRIRTQYTTHRAQQELDAQFVDTAGLLFQRQWFKIVKDYPKDCMKVRAWDMAATAKKDSNNPDWTAGVLMGSKDGQYWIIDVRHIQGTPLQVRELIRQTAQTDGKNVRIRIEQEPGSAGKIVMDDYARNVLAGYSFQGLPSTGSKETRADPVAAAAEHGNIFLVESSWNKSLLDEAEDFPAGKHDDIIDSMSGAFASLQRPTVSMV